MLNPSWQKISRQTLKSDCVKVYESEKKKLHKILSSVRKISLTTDLWTASHQKMEYLVITGHFVDDQWKLHKRVLSFVHIPPPRTGHAIADAIYKCLEQWGIENKVYSISVDNASSNDMAMRILKGNFSAIRTLPLDGQLFHVRCAAHILNLMVQDGLYAIRHIIDDIHDTISYIRQSEARLIIFSEIVKQLKLPNRKLILDCKTRWNSTYEMLSTALKFKEVFPRYEERDRGFVHCPTSEDWVKVEKVCAILEPFSSATNVISGSDYPTSNLFLTEIWGIKVMLEKYLEDEDNFIKAMVLKMKIKFDKYWGQCNLLMSLGPSWTLGGK